MRVKIILSCFIIGFLGVGCSSSSSGGLSLDSCGKNGNFCYKGVNYGPIKSPLFKKGIKDGCRTGEGFFTKNYALSSRSKDYFNGWIVGRSHCKQILPNEGTRQEEENSRKRAEYEIRKLRQEQSLGVEDTQEEGFIDSILRGGRSSSSSVEEVEY